MEPGVRSAAQTYEENLFTMLNCVGYVRPGNFVRCQSSNQSPKQADVQGLTFHGMQAIIGFHEKEYADLHSNILTFCHHSNIYLCLDMAISSRTSSLLCWYFNSLKYCSNIPSTSAVSCLINYSYNIMNSSTQTIRLYKIDDECCTCPCFKKEDVVLLCDKLQL